MTLIPFNYNEQQLRVVEIGGEPWFVLADLCRVLDVKQFRKERLDDDMILNHPIVDSLGRTQQAVIVNEPGMYEVVIRSDKPQQPDGEAISMTAIARRASWVAHIALIIMLTAIGPDSLLIAALALLVARTLWTLTPKATLS